MFLKKILSSFVQNSWARFFIFGAILFFVFRIIFWFTFKDPAKSLSVEETLTAFWFGSRFDFRLICCLLFPLYFLSFIPVLHPQYSLKASKVWSIFFTVCFFVIFVFYGVDIAYYAYLQTRLDATALKLLGNFETSMGMVWQTYHVIPSLIGLLVVTGIVYFVLRRFVFVKRDLATDPSKKILVTQRIIVFLVIAFCIHGKIGQYPLRWSEAFFSNNIFTSSLSLNPVLYFYDTYLYSTPDYDREKVVKSYDLMADYLGVTEKNPETLSFARHVVPTKKFKNRPNFVFIISESFAAHKTGVLGNSPLKLTPFFDSLANEGTLFTHHFVPSEATARSVFAALTNIPDVTTNKSSSRNPSIVSQNIVINALTDYDKYYFIGGSTNWGNIRGVIQFNIPGVKILEETDYKSSRNDVWGISDYDLFIEANKMLDTNYKKTNKPFFAFIQLADFHRPYKIPANLPDFKLIEVSPQEVKDSGFVSLDEVNALRFIDYSKAHFFKISKESSYFDNTIFIMIGDHGLPGHESKYIPAGKLYHRLEKFHVPLLFYGPKFFPAQKIDKPASELDILPTCVSLTGTPYLNTALGRDLFDPKFDDKRFSFVYYYYEKPASFGVVDDNYFYRTLFEKDSGLFKYTDNKIFDQKLDEQEPERAKKMQNLARGFLETARYMLYHNQNPIVQVNKVKK